MITNVLAILLFANAVFNFVVWPTFFRRILKDPRARDSAGRATRFLTVHAVIIGIALVLACASLFAGIFALVG